MKRTISTIAIVFLMALTAAVTPDSAAAAQTPTPPVAFAAAAYTYNSVKLTWQPVFGVSGYKLYRAAKKKGKYKCISTIAGNKTSFTNKKLKPEKTYYYKMRAYIKEENKLLYSGYTPVRKGKGKVSKPKNFRADDTRISDLAKLTWDKTPGVTAYWIYRAPSKNGKYKHIKTVSKSKTAYYDKSRKAGAVYYYKVRAVTKVGKKKYYSAYTKKDSALLKSYIMGQSPVTAAQLAENYRKNAQYPSYYSKNSKDQSADTLDKFCEMYISECNAEGVRADVAFSQAMLETGWLTFKGDARISQFNFAGIGATGGGRSGCSFGTVREGIRAQVQHLKAYGSKAPLKGSCVDPRFHYVKRASARYVEWLGIPENPKGSGWAGSRGYGYKIMKMTRQI